MDGDSKYDEIKGNEVLLEIEYLPIIKAGESNDEALKEKNSESDTNPEHKGLSLLKKSTCFGCHADKAKHSGPSFYEIAARYDNSPANISTLAGHISGGSMGVWGSMEMPSHPELTEMETKQIAEYILAQGAEENRWVQPGLEGVFRIIKKPENSDKGLYILTASYTSSSTLRGQYIVMLDIE
jgi:cytochrome c